MANNIQEEVQALKSDIAKIRTDIQDLISQLKEIGKQKIDEVRDSFESELSEQKERVRATTGRVKARGREAADEIEFQIGEHPLGSLVTAFGIGYLLALLSRDK